MFETTVGLWKQYRDRHSPAWPAGDPRHDLSGEVENRLEQLDIVLDYLDRALTVFRGDPEESARLHSYFQREHPRIDAGETTVDEFVEGTPWRNRSHEELLAEFQAWKEVHLFTETFYFVAWRLLVVLNGKGRFVFPGVRPIKARGICRVRNNLIEHPEGQSDNFQNSLMVLRDGPVLKTTGAVVRGSTHVAEPLDDSIDRGLYTNALEFKDEFEAKMRQALVQADITPA